MNGQLIPLLLLNNADINIFGYYDDYDILHINGFHSISKYITIDNILEFMKTTDIKFVYEPNCFKVTHENTSI